MIAAIDPGVGLKEDVPIAPVERSGNAGFSREFRTVTSGQTQASHSKPPDRPLGADPRARSAYERQRDAQRAADRPKDKGASEAGTASRKDKAGQTHGDAQAKDAHGEKVARDGTKSLDKAAEKNAADHPHLKHSESEPVVPVQGGELAQANLTLAPVDPSAGQPPASPDGRPPIDAQIGLAAYQMGPHAKGEGAAAEAAGATPPDGLAAMLPQGAPSTARELALQQAQAEAMPPHQPGEAPAFPDVLTLKKAPLDNQEPGKKSLEKGVEQNLAQARNQLLNSIGHTTGKAPDPRLVAALAPREALTHHGKAPDASAKDLRAEVMQPRSTVDGTPLAAMTHPAAGVGHAALARTDTDNAGRAMVDHIVQEARWLISHQRNEVTFKLHPEHLGQLHLKVLQKDGIMRVNMTVDTLAAKHLLETHLPELRQQMMAGHQGAGEFLFNVDVRKGNDSPPEAYARLRQSPGVGRGLEGADAIDAAAGRGLSRRVWGNHNVSIYV